MGDELYLPPIGETNPGELYTTEGPHKKLSNPKIMEYGDTVGGGIRNWEAGYKGDEIPWCSAFINWCVKQCGFKGTGSAAAKSWLEWGQIIPKNQVFKGCIVVTQRPGGHHVGLYAGIDGKYVKLLGGNQSNQVKVSTYALSSVLGYRAVGSGMIIETPVRPIHLHYA